MEGGSASLVAVDVASLVQQDRVGRLKEVRTKSQLVGQRAGDDKDGSFLACQSGNLGLEARRALVLLREESSQSAYMLQPCSDEQQRLTKYTSSPLEAKKAAFICESVGTVSVSLLRSRETAWILASLSCVARWVGTTLGSWKGLAAAS